MLRTASEERKRDGGKYWCVWIEKNTLYLFATAVFCLYSPGARRTPVLTPDRRRLQKRFAMAQQGEGQGQGQSSSPIGSLRARLALERSAS